MTTLSVPLSAEHMKFIDQMVSDGNAANKADVVRKALRLMEEEEAVARILRAQKEPTLRGDLRDLMKKMK